MGYEVWKTMRNDGKYKQYDWVVKTDADAVFLPARLLETLRNQPVTDKGIYLENCKKVMYGFFGNLEVFSAVAFQTLLDNMDDCKKHPRLQGQQLEIWTMGRRLACAKMHGLAWCEQGLG